VTDVGGGRPLDVLVTGLGAVSCVGRGVRALWDALEQGRSGLAADERMERLGMRCRVSGRVAGVDAAFAADESIEPRDTAWFSRFARLGYLAAREALADAALPAASMRPPEPSRQGGVLVGTGIGPLGEIDAHLRCAATGDRLVSPGHAVPRVMPSFLPSFLAQRLAARRGGATVSAACNSGLVALEAAVRDLTDGRADWYLVGAVEEDHPNIWWSFDTMRALPRTGDGEDPRRASCPFGQRARGFIPAGGAAFLVLETRRSAEARGARPHAIVRACEHRIAGGGVCAFDAAAYSETIGRALEQAGVDAADLDLFVPHAQSTPIDVDELSCVDERLDLLRHGVRIAAPKAILGHAIGASGLLDVIATIGVLADTRRSSWPAHARLHDRVERFAPLFGPPRHAATLRYGIKAGHSFGGSVAAVVLESVL
jgi:3-oxoacyl-(acyl-carrier-protein) synthase